MLRAASIGMGWWSDELADAAQGKSDAIRIVTCFSRSEEKRAAFAEKYGTAQHDSYEAVLADDSVDAVILTTPHSIHAEQAIAAAAAGKHVFCEKPFTLTRASAQAAVDACAEAGVVLAVGQNRRWHSATRTLKAMLEAGDFGTVPMPRRISPCRARSATSRGSGGSAESRARPARSPDSAST